jgi:hypothetical protein
MSQPDLTTTKFIVRCMGGDKCNHAAGTCTATQTPEDWVLIEAAKRFEWNNVATSELRRHYHDENYIGFRALCDMIAKHEQKPVDRKLLCAREACALSYKTMAESYRSGQCDANSAVIFSLRAITLWEEGFGE